MSAVDMSNCSLEIQKNAAIANTLGSVYLLKKSSIEKKNRFNVPLREKRDQSFNTILYFLLILFCT